MQGDYEINSQHIKLNLHCITYDIYEWIYICYELAFSNLLIMHEVINQ